MNNRKEKGDFWPTPLQEILLQACLLKSHKAVTSFHSWKQQIDIKNLDPGSYRLLPLLYSNMRENGIQDPSMAFLKGVFRFHWVKNTLLFKNMRPVLCALHDAGIQTMFLKGWPLAAIYYKNLGTRPMDDLDVLVPFSQAHKAVQVLIEQGFRPKAKPLLSRIGPLPCDAFFACRHGHGFLSPDNNALDLHWHVLKENCSRSADELFWKKSVPFSNEGMGTRTLNPTDHLLSICVHGARYNRVPSIRWAADAMQVLTAPDIKLDWDHLMAQADTHGLVLPMRDTLTYLKGLLNAPIPDHVLKHFSKKHVSFIDRLSYKYAIENTIPKPMASVVLKRWSEYKDENNNRKWLGFPKHLQQQWNLKHVWLVPKALIRRTRNRGRFF